MSDELEKLKQELDEFKKKSDDYLNSWKRTAADFENYKKRQDREAKELVQFAQEVTVVKMLPTLESLEAALKNPPQFDLSPSPSPGLGRVADRPGEVADFQKRYQTWSEGVLKIVQQLEKVLMEMGIEKIKIIVGETKFDPALHEAIEMVESDKESGIVVEELQTGFRLNGKLIRPAKVKVAR